MMLRRVVVASRFSGRNAGLRHYSASAKPRNVLFFGSGDVALETVKTLHKRTDLVSSLSVVCPPEKLVGSDASVDAARGVVVRKWAMKNNIPIFTYLKEDISPVCTAARQADLGVVVDFGYLLPQRLLDNFKTTPILMHPSLLPKYRGASPIEYAIMNGETSSGVSVLTLHPSKFDAGRTLLQATSPLSPDETVKEIRPQLARLGAEAVATVLAQYEELMAKANVSSTGGSIPPITAPKLKPADFWPVWTGATPVEIYNKWRGLLTLRAKLQATPELEAQMEKPNPLQSVVMLHEFKNPASTPLHVILGESSAGLSQQQIALRDLLAKQPAGALFFDKERNYIWIKCGSTSQSSWIAATKLQLPSRAIVDATSFVNGIKMRKPELMAQLRLVAAMD